MNRSSIAQTQSAQRSNLRRGALCSGLAFGAALLMSNSSRAGYELSISASDQDPHVNTDEPTEEVRNLYLWLTCSELGASALEAQTIGSLQPLGFTPRNGVMNAGSTSGLILAIPGCPTGSNVDFLLGYWVVVDDGGELCLGPSAESDRIGVVDCETNPNFWENPRIIGFSSTTSSPCDVGNSSCQQDLAPSGATYSEFLVTEGALPYDEPWSPFGKFLIFNSPDGLFAFDGDNPEDPPRRLCDMKLSHASWSPDGTWILGIVGSGTETLRGENQLIAVPLNGRGAIVLAERQAIGKFLWGNDGAIYWWHRSSRSRTKIDPPDGWIRDQSRPARSKSRLLIIDDPATTGWDVVSFAAEADGVNQNPLSELTFDHGLRLFEQEALRDEEGFLVRIHDPASPLPFDAIIDEVGRKLVVFPADGLKRTSVSSDGSYLVANSWHDDGHAVTTADLYIASRRGTWRLPVSGAPMGHRAHLSREGHYVAFQSIERSGYIHVGQLAVER